MLLLWKNVQAVISNEGCLMLNTSWTVRKINCPQVWSWNKEKTIKRRSLPWFADNIDCTQSSLCISRECVCGHCRNVNLASAVHLFSTNFPIHCQRCCQECDPSLYWSRQDQSLLLLGKHHFFALIEILRKKTFIAIVFVFNERIDGFHNIC